jgi:alpha-L-fucosidase
MGRWMKTNGEAIYGSGSSPFRAQLPWGRATRTSGKLYLHVFDWPADATLNVPAVAGKVTGAKLLGAVGPVIVNQTAEGLTVKLPAKAPNAMASVIALEVPGSKR